MAIKTSLKITQEVLAFDTLFVFENKMENGCFLRGEDFPSIWTNGFIHIEKCSRICFGIFAAQSSLSLLQFVVVA